MVFGSSPLPCSVGLYILELGDSLADGISCHIIKCSIWSNAVGRPFYCYLVGCTKHFLCVYVSAFLSSVRHNRDV